MSRLNSTVLWGFRWKRELIGQTKSATTARIERVAVFDLEKRKEDAWVTGSPTSLTGNWPLPQSFSGMVDRLPQVGEPYGSFGKTPGFIGPAEPHVHWDEPLQWLFPQRGVPFQFPCRNVRRKRTKSAPARMSAGEFGHAAL